MIKAALLDLSGVVYQGTEALPGAVDALRRLKAANIPYRFVSNTTQITPQQVVARLASMGVSVAKEDLYLPVNAVRQYLENYRLKPLLLVTKDLEAEFEGLAGGAGDAVVIGDAGAGFSYENLNAAFRALMAGAPLLALARNRYYRAQSGELYLDAGPFVTALEYASGTDALLFGKPSADFFLAAVSSLRCEATDVVMVGDDVESDVAGAMAVGMDGILVRTGKYRRGAESGVTPPPSVVVADLPAAVDWILEHR